MSVPDTNTLRANDLLGTYLAVALERFESHQAQVLVRDDLEDIHQARVGIRRMRCALRTFRPVFDRLWARSVRNAAVLFAYPLGRVRDADVVLERERPHLKELSSPIVLESLEKIRRERRQHLIASLTSEQADATLALMKDAVARPRLIAGTGTTIDDLTPSAKATLRKLRKSVRRLGPTPSDQDLHRVRILTKRARYAAEVLRPVVGDDAKRFCRAAAALQDALGELQDAVVCRSWMFELIPTLDETSAKDAHHLAGVELANAQAARASWPQRFEALADENVSGWLE